jgi:hypothetical protein
MPDEEPWNGELEGPPIVRAVVRELGGIRSRRADEPAVERVDAQLAWIGHGRSMPRAGEVFEVSITPLRWSRGGTAAAD